MRKRWISWLLVLLIAILPVQVYGTTQEAWNETCRYKTSRDTAVYDRTVSGASSYFYQTDILPAGTYINVISGETNGKRRILYLKDGKETVAWLDTDAFTSALKTVIAADGNTYSLPEAVWGNETAVRRFMASYYTPDQIQMVLNQMYAEAQSYAVLPEDSWTCPVCGRAGNTNLFCPECGTRRGTVPMTTVPYQRPAVSVGEVLLIGRYGGEELLWQVIGVQGSKVLLLSRYGLEKNCFNTNCAGQTWENCTLRKWLNGAFLSQAFSAAEAQAILETYVNEAEDQASKAFAPKRIGASTYDHLFLLSYAELTAYLPSIRDRQCVPTAHALAEGCNYSDTLLIDGQPACWWWLRSPAYRNNALVVNASGNVEACMMSQSYGAVRPVMWVDVDTLDRNGELSFGSPYSHAPVRVPVGTSNPAARIATQNTPSPTPGVPTAQPSQKDARQEVCRSFILNAQYQSFSGSFDSDRISFALHDTDGDNAPELLVHNGETEQGRSRIYVVALYDNGYRLLQVLTQDKEQVIYTETNGFVADFWSLQNILSFGWNAFFATANR